jgi:DNA-binding transcriptional LysR family regulator
LALPLPPRVSNLMAAARKRGLLAPAKGRGRVWAVSPEGRERVRQLITDIDMAALLSEAQRSTAALFGGAVHPVIPPSLAPHALLHVLRRFLAEHPFELNVLGMTRVSRIGRCR